MSTNKEICQGIIEVKTAHKILGGVFKTSKFKANIHVGECSLGIVNIAVSCHGFSADDLRDAAELFTKLAEALGSH